MLDFDPRAVAELAQRLKRIQADKQMDTLAMLIKVFIEADSRWSPLADVWRRV